MPCGRSSAHLITLRRDGGREQLRVEDLELVRARFLSYLRMGSFVTLPQDACLGNARVLFLGRVQPTSFAVRFKMHRKVTALSVPISGAFWTKRTANSPRQLWLNAYLFLHRLKFKEFYYILDFTRTFDCSRTISLDLVPHITREILVQMHYCHARSVNLTAPGM